MEILKELCDYRLDAIDVPELLKCFPGDQLRIDPLGFDDDGMSYWYFYGTRLYRAAPGLLKGGDCGERKGGDCGERKGGDCGERKGRDCGERKGGDCGEREEGESGEEVRDYDTDDDDDDDDDDYEDVSSPKKKNPLNGATAKRKILPCKRPQARREDVKEIEEDFDLGKELEWLNEVIDEDEDYEEEEENEEEDEEDKEDKEGKDGGEWTPTGAKGKGRRGKGELSFYGVDDD